MLEVLGGSIDKVSSVDMHPKVGISLIEVLVVIIVDQFSLHYKV